MNHQVERNFKTYPLTEDQANQRQEIVIKAKELADFIDQLLEESREKSLAMTKLEEFVFWANAGVARNV